MDGTSSDEVHVTDTTTEKLSLADRFGLTLAFPKPTPGQYQDIVVGIAKKKNMHISEDFLREQALAWEVNHRGMSGRTAKQFINSVVGELHKG